MHPAPLQCLACRMKGYTGTQQKKVRYLTTLDDRAGGGGRRL